MMKRLVLWFMALTFMGGLAMAQGGRKGSEQMDPKDRAARMTELMVKEYSLNDTQKEQLQEANLAWMQKMNGQRRKSTDDIATKVSKEDREKMRKEMKESREAYDKQLKEILTKEQFEAYAKKQAERESKMKNRRQQ